LILCVYAISKKYLKTKRKTFFDLRFFYLSQGEEKEKSNTLTGQIVICLVRALPERERVLFLQTEWHSKLLFLSLLECRSLLQKTIPEIEKRKEKHNTQKIIKI
jgi:hypothetical protein